MPGPSARSSSPGVLLNLFQSIALATVISLSNVASQLALHPLYGGTATSLHFTILSLLVCLAGASLPRFVNTRSALTLMSLLLAVAPVLLHRVGARASSWLDPIWGPIATQLVGAIPILFLGAGILTDFLNFPILRIFNPAIIRIFNGILSWFAITRGDQVLWDHLPTGGQITSCSLYIFLVFVTSTAAAFLALVSTPDQRKSQKRRSGPSRYGSSKSLPFAAGAHFLLPLILSFVIQIQPPCTSPACPYFAANNTLHVLERAHSVTGTIVIADFLDGPFRFMRCDQSLLGGKWLVPRAEGLPATELGESIYSAFIFQEAVRLVERQSPRKRERVLNIGVGVGIALDAFIAHGLHTTAIEIDPAVYRLARKYFALSKPDEVYLEDARRWVSTRAAARRQRHGANVAIDDDTRFDFIIHDCFSGGGVPPHLFTIEFWEDLKEILDPTGVVAVNYAGTVHDDAAHAILATLLAVFAQCRIFHDHGIAQGKLPPKELMNIVFFCTLSSAPFKFRTAKKTDYLNTVIRRHFLNQLDHREIPITSVLGAHYAKNTTELSRWIITDANNPLGIWQRRSAIEHWKVMRTALPHDIWNVY